MAAFTLQLVKAMNTQQLIHFLLADDQSYNQIKKWADKSERTRTAKLYWQEFACDEETWDDSTSFRAHFPNLRIDDVLAMHESLNDEFPKDIRIDTTQFELVTRYFCPTAVSREQFGEAILALPRESVRKLVEAATEKNLCEERKRIQAVHSAEVTKLTKRWNNRRKPHAPVRTAQVRLLVTGYQAQVHRPECPMNALQDSKHDVGHLNSEVTQAAMTKEQESSEFQRSNLRHSLSPDLTPFSTAATHNQSILDALEVDKLEFTHWDNEQDTTCFFDPPSHQDPKTISQLKKTPKKPAKKLSPTKSPYFPLRAKPKKKRKKKSTAGTVSCIPFPALSSRSFGLIQELLADDPFQLILAVIFLNKTKATASLPVFWTLTDRYPTAKDLHTLTMEDIVAAIRHLGMQNQRAKTILSLAETWIEQPPQRGCRYRTLHYPSQGDGKDVKPNETVDDDDQRAGAWEIAHLAGVGDYALDSWRIFCRDKLRGVAQSYNGQGAPDGFEPEWMRVLPRDKELRAYLRWMWFRRGWEWDPLTGRKRKASAELLQQVEAGNLVWSERNWDVGSSSEAELRLLDDERSSEHVETFNQKLPDTTEDSRPATALEDSTFTSTDPKKKKRSKRKETLKNKKAKLQ